MTNQAVVSSMVSNEKVQKAINTVTKLLIENSLEANDKIGMYRHKTLVEDALEGLSKEERKQVMTAATQRLSDIWATEDAVGHNSTR